MERAAAAEQTFQLKIGWDGFRRNRLQQLLDPHFRDLCKQCRRLNFLAIFAGKEEAFIARFSGVSSSLSRSPCRFCRVLASMFPSYSHEMQPISGHLLPENMHKPLGWPIEVMVVYIHFYGIHGYIVLESDVRNACRKSGLPFKQYTGQVDFAALRSAIDDCRDGHEQCKKRTYSPPADARVIDCETRRIVPLTRDLLLDAGYLTLSYCWGKHTGEATTRDKTLPLPRLPPTIEDAILATKGLGFRYLWVDRYCIDQEGGDKMRQIQQMANIYNNGVATIVSLGPDGDSKLERVAVDSSTTPVVITEDGKGKSFMAMTTEETMRRWVSNSKWSSRGWTYQEGLLSRRCIIFTPNEAFVVCHSGTCKERKLPFSPRTETQSETIPSLLGTKSKYTNAVKFEEHLTQYQKRVSQYTGAFKFEVHVEQYQKREFSFQEDALDAFRGVLTLLDNQSYYGLPIPHLSDRDVDHVAIAFNRALLWASNTSDREAPESDLDALANARPGLPSWSWIAHRGVIPIWLHWKSYSCKANNTTLIVDERPVMENRFDMTVIVPGPANGNSSIQSYASNEGSHKLLPERTCSLLLTSFLSKLHVVFEPSNKHSPTIFVSSNARLAAPELVLQTFGLPTGTLSKLDIWFQFDYPLKNLELNCEVILVEFEVSRDVVDSRWLLVEKTSDGHFRRFGVLHYYEPKPPGFHFTDADVGMIEKWKTTILLE